MLISRRLQLSADALKSVRWAHFWSLRISLTLRFAPLISITRISPKNATDSSHQLPRTRVHFSRTHWSRQAARLNHCHGHLWFHQIIASSGPCATDASSIWSTIPIRRCFGKVYARSGHYRCFASSGAFLMDQAPTDCQWLLLDSLNLQRLLFVPSRHFLEITHLQVWSGISRFGFVSYSSAYVETTSHGCARDPNLIVFCSPPLGVILVGYASKICTLRPRSHPQLLLPLEKHRRMSNCPPDSNNVDRSIGHLSLIGPALLSVDWNRLPLDCRLRPLTPRCGEI